MTELGQLMVEFPLYPGLTRALLKAAALGCQDLLLPVAAMLSVENIFIRPGQQMKMSDVIKSLLREHYILLNIMLRKSNISATKNICPSTCCIYDLL